MAAPPEGAGDKGLIEEIRQAGSIVVTDALNLRSGLPAGIRPLTSKADFCGRALTVQVEPGDNRAAYEALSNLRVGDVLVVGCADAQDVAMVGGTLAGHCRNRGAVGIVTDGMIRDWAALEELGLPVWASGRVPNAPTKLHAGTVGGAVKIGAVTINTGDIIVADIDGVTVIPEPQPTDFVMRLRAMVEREERLAAGVERGEHEPAWLADIRSQESSRDGR
jgi:4-hydroxy-4-methyl-2-oxoglutarate aldolase